MEILGKIETDNLVARIDAALDFIAALLPDVTFSALAEATDLVDATGLVTVAVVLPDLKLAASTAVVLTTFTIRVSLVFRFASTTPSTTAALLSLLAAVIQFSSLWK